MYIIYIGILLKSMRKTSILYRILDLFACDSNLNFLEINFTSFTIFSLNYVVLRVSLNGIFKKYWIEFIDFAMHTE